MLRFHFTAARIPKINETNDRICWRRCRTGKHLFTAGQRVNYTETTEIIGKFAKKHTHLPPNPDIQLLVIYPKDYILYRDTWSFLEIRSSLAVYQMTNGNE